MNRHGVIIFIHQMEMNGNIIRKSQNTTNSIHARVKTVLT